MSMDINNSGISNKQEEEFKKSKLELSLSDPLHSSLANENGTVAGNIDVIMTTMALGEEDGGGSYPPLGDVIATTLAIGEEDGGGGYPPLGAPIVTTMALGEEDDDGNRIPPSDGPFEDNQTNAILKKADKDRDGVLSDKETFNYILKHKPSPHTKLGPGFRASDLDILLGLNQNAHDMHQEINQINKDGNKRISNQEIIDVIKNDGLDFKDLFMSKNKNSDMLKELFAGIDTNSDKTISKEEVINKLLKMNAEKTQGKEKQLSLSILKDNPDFRSIRRNLNRIDRNRDGEVSDKEVSRILKQVQKGRLSLEALEDLKPILSKNENLDSLLHEFGLGDKPENYNFDQNGDGKVDREEVDLAYDKMKETFLKTEGQEGFNAAFDYDHDGDVDGQDYGKFGQEYSKHIQNLPPEEEVNKAAELLVPDSAGNVSKAQVKEAFMAVMEIFGLEANSEDFNAKLDLDDDGVIGQQDLSLLLSEAMKYYSADEIQALLTEEPPVEKHDFDIDGNGFVSEEEIDTTMELFRETNRKEAGEEGFNAAFDFDDNGVVNSDDEKVLIEEYKKHEKYNFDANDNGYVNKEEINLAYEKFQATFLKQAGQEGFDHRFDYDGDGDVDGMDYGNFGQKYGEQLQTLAKKEAILAKINEVFDFNGDGRADKTEAGQGIQDIIDAYSIQEQTGIAADSKYDINSDGAVSALDAVAVLNVMGELRESLEVIKAETLPLHEETVNDFLNYKAIDYYGVTPDGTSGKDRYFEINPRTNEQYGSYAGWATIEPRDALENLHKDLQAAIENDAGLEVFDKVKDLNEFWFENRDDVPGVPTFFNAAATGDRTNNNATYSHIYLMYDLGQTMEAATDYMNNYTGLPQEDENIEEVFGLPLPRPVVPNITPIEIQPQPIDEIEEEFFELPPPQDPVNITPIEVQPQPIDEIQEEFFELPPPVEEEVASTQYGSVAFNPVQAEELEYSGSESEVVNLLAETGSNGNSEAVNYEAMQEAAKQAEIAQYDHNRDGTVSADEKGKSYSQYINEMQGSTNV